jgi:hypothetical protein
LRLDKKDLAEISEPLATLSEDQKRSATLPNDKCSYGFDAIGRVVCGRPLLEGHDKCYWHVPSDTKYKPEILRKYFNN